MRQNQRRAELRCKPAGYLSGCPGLIGNMAPVNIGLSTPKNFTAKFLQFGHASSRSFPNPILGQKKEFKKYRFVVAPSH